MEVRLTNGNEGIKRLTKEKNELISEINQNNAELKRQSDIRNQIDDLDRQIIVLSTGRKPLHQVEELKRKKENLTELSNKKRVMEGQIAEIRQIPALQAELAQLEAQIPTARNESLIAQNRRATGFVDAARTLNTANNVAHNFDAMVARQKSLKERLSKALPLVGQEATLQARVNQIVSVDTELTQVRTELQLAIDADNAFKKIERMKSERENLFNEEKYHLYPAGVLIGSLIRDNDRLTKLENELRDLTRDVNLLTSLSNETKAGLEKTLVDKNSAADASHKKGIKDLETDTECKRTQIRTEFNTELNAITV
jgi:hypothetical protein